MDMNQMRAQQQAAAHQAQHAAAAEHEATLQSAAQFGNPRDAPAQSFPSQYAMGGGAAAPGDMMGGPAMAAATAQAANSHIGGAGAQG